MVFGIKTKYTPQRLVDFKRILLRLNRAILNHLLQQESPKSHNLYLSNFKMLGDINSLVPIKAC